MEALTVLVNKTRKESSSSDTNQPDTSFYGAVVDILAETRQLDGMHSSLKQVANQMSQESAATVNQVNAQIQEQKKELERLIELNDQFQQKLQEKLQANTHRVVPSHAQLAIRPSPRVPSYTDRLHTSSNFKLPPASPCRRSTAPYRTLCFSSGDSLSSSSSTTTTAPPTQGVLVKFRVAYRCNFGHQLCLLGSGEPLGSWDMHQPVGMQWSPGDIWCAEVFIPAHSTIDSMIEYKYLVRNEADGVIVAWKPGGNFSLKLPINLQEGAAAAAGGGGAIIGTVRVDDAWDETTREIEILIQEQVFSEDSNNNNNRSQGRGTSSSSEEGDEDDPVATLTRVATVALSDLDGAVTSSLELLDTIDDPASPAMLAADRKVAAASQRVAAMSRALDAATPMLLPRTKKKTATSDDGEKKKKVVGEANRGRKPKASSS